MRLTLTRRLIISSPLPFSSFYSPSFSRIYTVWRRPKTVTVRFFGRGGMKCIGHDTEPGGRFGRRQRFHREKTPRLVQEKMDKFLNRRMELKNSNILSGREGFCCCSFLFPPTGNFTYSDINIATCFVCIRSFLTKILFLPSHPPYKWFDVPFSPFKCMNIYDSVWIIVWG